MQTSNFRHCMIIPAGATSKRLKKTLEKKHWGKPGNLRNKSIFVSCWINQISPFSTSRSSEKFCSLATVFFPSLRNLKLKLRSHAEDIYIFSKVDVPHLNFGLDAITLRYSFFFWPAIKSRSCWQHIAHPHFFSEWLSNRPRSSFSPPTKIQSDEANKISCC